LFERHADRILFGTDSFPIRKAEYCAYFRLLESSDEHYSYSNLPTPPNGRWTISGLALDDTVLEQVYAANAARLLDRVAV
jgi:predicted TIM-barrel fold metal-dependent hydrolase